MEQEQEEALAAEISEQLGRTLKALLCAERAPSAAEMRVALDYVKHHGITDDPNRAGNPAVGLGKVIEQLSLPPFPDVGTDVDANIIIE